MYAFNCSRVKDGLIVDNADIKCLCSTLQTDMPLFSRAYKAAYDRNKKNQKSQGPLSQITSLSELSRVEMKIPGRKVEITKEGKCFLAFATTPT